MFQTDHHNQVMELCSCSKDNQFKFSFSHSFRGDQYLPLHLLHTSLVVHSHCKTMRKILIKWVQNPVEICWYLSMCSMNTSTQFYTSHYLYVLVSSSVNTQ